MWGRSDSQKYPARFLCGRSFPPIAFLLRAIRASARKARSIVENTIDVREGRNAEMQSGTTRQNPDRCSVNRNVVGAFA
jgi:hypothetical protein